MSNKSGIAERASLQGEAGQKLRSRFLIRPKIFDNIQNWLAGLVKASRLSDEEQKDAGINLDYQHYK